MFIQTQDSAPASDPVNEISSLLAEEEEVEEEVVAEAATEEEAAPVEEVEAEEEPTWEKVLGVESGVAVIDDEGNLTGINVKVDGKVSTVEVKELIAGYQLNKHVTQKSQALADDRRQFEAVRNQASSVYMEKLQTAEKLTSYLEQALLQDFNTIDWQRLRVENPGEYAAKYAEFQTRKGQLDSITTSTRQERQTQQSALSEEEQQKYQAHLSEQYNAIVAQNPEWTDPAKMREAFTQLGQFVSDTYGITEQEFSNISDARHVSILRDAMAYRSGKEIASKKLAAKLPKFQKAGKTTKPMDEVTKATLRANKARGAQKRELQTDAVAKLLMG
jgi:hypothetical protein